MSTSGHPMVLARVLLYTRCWNTQVELVSREICGTPILQAVMPL